MNHSFNADIAFEVGIEAATILENIYFWCKKNEANNKLVNGKPFTYNSVKAFTEIFFYMSPSTISRSLKKLEESGFVETGVFNSNAYDRTKWYCITSKTRAFYDPKTVIENCDMQSANSEDCICQNEKWSRQNDKCNLQNEKSISQKVEMNIADINTDNKPNINTDIHTSVRVCEENKNLSNVGEIQKYTYNAIATHNAKSDVSRKIPISNSLMSFVQKEFRELISEHRDSLGEVKSAVENYILVSESDTWKKFYSWRDLIKNFNSYTSEYFDIHKFVSEPESSQKKVSEEYSESLNQEREEIAERERIQNLRDIYEDFTPIRKNFVKDLFEMYRSHGMYNDYSQDDFNLEFAEVADELSNVSSKILKMRFEEYFAHEFNIQNLKNVVSHKLINLEE